jgi:oligoendopeptidase F
VISSSEPTSDAFENRKCRCRLRSSVGGTKHHSELLAPFGLDARDPKFWDGGLSVIANLITELEGLG